MKLFAASVLVADPHRYPPDGSAKKDLMKSDSRRGSSNVSALSADSPVTVGYVAGGIRRASGCRMIVGSH